MKKGWLYALVAVVVLALVCVLTCPDRDAHSDALKDRLDKVLTAELAKDSDFGEDAGLAAFGTLLGKGFGGLVIDKMLKVDNYFVCSIGTVTYDGKDYVVSVGVLGHVFTADENDVKKAVDEIF